MRFSNPSFCCIHQLILPSDIWDPSHSCLFLNFKLKSQTHSQPLSLKIFWWEAEFMYFPVTCCHFIAQWTVYVNFSCYENADKCCIHKYINWPLTHLRSSFQHIKVLRQHKSPWPSHCRSVSCYDALFLKFWGFVRWALCECFLLFCFSFWTYSFRTSS